MSSLTEKMKQQLADLRRQYNEGELTGDQLSALMLQAIETEAAKPAKEMNDAWLTACSELMASADQDKLAKVPDHAERIRSKLVEAIRKDQKVQQRRLAYHMATAAACFLIIFAGVSFSKQWFRATQSPDEQVYNLMGQKVEIQTGNQAAADGDEAWRECETTSFQELCDFLGYVPQMPTWIPEGWRLNSYYAVIDGESQQISVAYEHPEHKHLLTYDYLQADDVSNISVDFYQDGAGKRVQLQNGLDIYLTTNTDDPVAVWTTASSYACATGPITVDDLKTFILSIQ